MKFLKSIDLRIILTLLIAVHLLVLLSLRFFPYPELFIYSYLTENGLTPYKEIFDQHFPGLMFFPLNFATLGLNGIIQMRAIHLILIVINHLLIYLTGRKIFENDLKAILANFVFLLWQPFLEGYVLWIDSFIPPILLAALYIMISVKKKNSRFFWVGFLISLALLFKQTVAPLVILIFIYLIIFKKSFDQIKYLILGGIPAFFLLATWIITNGIWKDFIYWTLTFNLTIFSEMGRKFPTISGLIKVSPVIILPLFYLFYLRKREIKSILVLTFFLGSLAFAYARFDYIHLQPALPFGILLLIILFEKVSERFKVASVITFLMISIYFIRPLYLINKGGDVTFFGDFERQLSEKVQNYAQAEDVTFSFGTTPHLYYLTNTLPPGRLFVFQFPWFMKIAEERILSGIINDPPKAVIRDSNAQTAGMRLVEYMPNIDKYINDNYQVVDMVGDTEILVKKVGK